MARWKKSRDGFARKGSMRLSDSAVKAWKRTVKQSDEPKDGERRVVFR